MFEPRDIISAFWVIVLGGLIGLIVGMIQTFIESPEMLFALLM